MQKKIDPMETNPSITSNFNIKKMSLTDEEGSSPALKKSSPILEIE